jgi:hypothetical protein
MRVEVLQRCKSMRLDSDDVTQKLRNALIVRVELPPSPIVGI